METLSCLLNRVVEGNYISGSKIVDGRDAELVISHLLYADDTLLLQGRQRSVKVSKLDFDVV